MCGVKWRAGCAARAFEASGVVVLASRCGMRKVRPSRAKQQTKKKKKKKKKKDDASSNKQRVRRSRCRARRRDRDGTARAREVRGRGPVHGRGGKVAPGRCDLPSALVASDRGPKGKQQRRINVGDRRFAQPATQSGDRGLSVVLFVHHHGHGGRSDAPHTRTMCKSRTSNRQPSTSRRCPLLQKVFRSLLLLFSTADPLCHRHHHRRTLL